MITAPVIRRQNQALALGLGYAAFCVLYLGSGAFHLRPPVILGASAVDRLIPFIDWTIWIYASQFTLLPLAVVQARDDADRSQGFYAMLAATALAAAVFVSWPTQLERQGVPAGGATGLAWTVLYLADTPNNCFPSLHVALAAIAGRLLWRRERRVVAVAWPVMIAAATLTTKQHVAWDIAGGLVLAAVAWTLVPKLLRHERAQPIRHAAGA